MKEKKRIDGVRNRLGTRRIFAMIGIKGRFNTNNMRLPKYIETITDQKTGGLSIKR